MYLTKVMEFKSSQEEVQSQDRSIHEETHIEFIGHS